MLLEGAGLTGEKVRAWRQLTGKTFAIHEAASHKTSYNHGSRREVECRDGPYSDFLDLRLALQVTDACGWQRRTPESRPINKKPDMPALSSIGPSLSL